MLGTYYNSFKEAYNLKLIGLALLVFSGLLIFIKISISRRRRLRDNFMNIGYIRRLDGFEFESYFEKQVRGLGLDAIKTSSSYDYGVDIFIGDYAIQLKNYRNTVGISAVQEIYAGAHYYGKEPVVLASNKFSQPAINLAEKLGIELIDIEDILNWGKIPYRRSYPHKRGVFEIVRKKLIISYKGKRAS